MIQMEFQLDNGTQIIRVNRRTAKALYDNREPVYFCASNMHPGPPWYPECCVQKTEPDEAFEYHENEFRFYNCSAETGKRINYFREKTEAPACVR